MKKIKILLGDPRHSTVGSHSNFVPIGIGYIGSNLKKQFEKSNNEIELKLATDPREIFKIFSMCIIYVCYYSNIWFYYF